MHGCWCHALSVYFLSLPELRPAPQVWAKGGGRGELKGTVTTEPPRNPANQSSKLSKECSLLIRSSSRCSGGMSRRLLAANERGLEGWF